MFPGRLAVVAACVALAVSLVTPAYAAISEPANTAPEHAVTLGNGAESAISGTTGGSFQYYLYEHPGDGLSVSFAIGTISADPGVFKVFGLLVYSQTENRLVAESASTDDPAIGKATYKFDRPDSLLLQVYNFSDSTVAYRLTASAPDVTPSAAAKASSPVTITEPGQKVVTIDPGHGGPEVGAASPDGTLAEKNVNLSIALRLATLLTDDGYKAVLTRDADRSVSPSYDATAGRGGSRNDLQARVDIANSSNSDIFVSIHNNGGPASASGTEVWFNNARPFADRNHVLASLVLDNLVSSIHGLGYPVVNRGLKDDANFRIFRGRAYNLYVLGPGDGPRVHVPTEMPGVLGESLFLSNPVEAQLLKQSRTIDAIAHGYLSAIQQYFKQYPE